MTEDLIVKRSIRKKGVASTRTSKRQVGCAAEEILIAGAAKSKDTMTLIKAEWEVEDGLLTPTGIIFPT